MIRLTYASNAKKEWSSEDLLKLLEKCRTNNAAKNITGTLLYSNETFFQVLEGEEAAVENLYRTIEKDPRHKNSTIIEKKHITEREFPYWSMGFEKIDSKELGKIEGLNNFFENNFTPAGFASNKKIIGPLLSHLHSKLVKQVSSESHEELAADHDDLLLQYAHRTIRIGVKFLSLLMVGVILFSVADVLRVIWVKVINSPHFLMTTNDLVETFGAFLAVLIAIEIFINITVYIRSDVFPVKLVVATALMAISRKVIVFDYKQLDPEYVSASALVLVALGITYMLIAKSEKVGKK